MMATPEMNPRMKHAAMPISKLQLKRAKKASNLGSKTPSPSAACMVSTTAAAVAKQGTNNPGGEKAQRQGKNIRCLELAGDGTDYSDDGDGAAGVGKSTEAYEVFDALRK